MILSDKLQKQLNMMLNYFLNACLLKIINKPTATEIAASAILKIGSKKVNRLPPKNGIQSGSCVSMSGKEIISTTLP